MLNIQKNFSLLKYNTFHIDAKAKFFVEISCVEDFYELMNTDEFQNNEKIFLGGGSNVLFTKDFEGIVIKNKILGKNIIKETKKNVYVKVGSGEQRNSFVFWCVKNNFGGLENLISIPGTVGASPIQNIGAYGVEAKDLIWEVEGVNIENGGIDPEVSRVKKLKNEDCKFGYRDSVFKRELKGKFFITSVVFKLKKIDSDSNYRFNLNYKDIEQKMSELNLTEKDLDIKKFVDIIVSLRVGKLPNHHEVGTAGSFFKNPVIQKSDYKILKKNFSDVGGFDTGDGVKLSAGQLIEKAGFKGIKKGNVGVYHGHALILVNYGGGTGKEIVELASEIQSKIFEMFKVKLEPEVIFV